MWRILCASSSGLPPDALSRSVASVAGRGRAGVEERAFVAEAAGDVGEEEAVVGDVEVAEEEGAAGPDDLVAVGSGAGGADDGVAELGVADEFVGCVGQVVVEGFEEG